MIQEIIPTEENSLSICIKANHEYLVFKESPPKNELQIINWRAAYFQFSEFLYPEILINNDVIKTFKQNFEESIDFFLALIEKNEKDNITERVSVCLAEIEIGGPYYLLPITEAISPKGNDKYNKSVITNALINPDYYSFYIENGFENNLLNISASDFDFAVHIFKIGINNKIINQKQSESFTLTEDLKGLLILNAEKFVEEISEYFITGKIIEITRVR